MSNVFWIKQPRALISSATVVPHRGMCDEELLNTLTRLVIVITLVLLLFGFKHWWVFLLGGIVLILLLWYLGQHKSDPSDVVQHFRCPRAPRQPRVTNTREGEAIRRLTTRR